MSLVDLAKEKGLQPDYSALPPHTKDGKIPFEIRHPAAKEPCFTYYKVFGDLNCGSPPMVVLHGGPGAGHEGMSLAFSEFWQLYGLPVIVYDQIGCGQSSHFPHTMGDHTFWTPELYRSELDNLIDHFKLREAPGYHIVGQSWGAMLGAYFAGYQPKGLQRLVLCSGNASKVLSASGVLINRLSLPPEIQKTLTEHEAARDFDSPEYKAAVNVFYEKYLLEPGAKGLSLGNMFSLKHIQDDPTSHMTAQGPNLVLNEGSMNKFTAIPNLHKIEAPTLVINGDHDTSHDISQEPYFELIPRVRWITLPNATHGWLGQRELRPRYLKLIGEFLTPAKMEDRARQKLWYADKPGIPPGWA